MEEIEDGEEQMDALIRLLELKDDDFLQRADIGNHIQVKRASKGSQTRLNSFRAKRMDALR